MPPNAPEACVKYFVKPEIVSNAFFLGIDMTSNNIKEQTIFLCKTKPGHSFFYEKFEIGSTEN